MSEVGQSDGGEGHGGNSLQKTNDRSDGSSVPPSLPGPGGGRAGKPRAKLYGTVTDATCPYIRYMYALYMDANRTNRSTAGLMAEFTSLQRARPPPECRVREPRWCKSSWPLDHPRTAQIAERALRCPIKRGFLGVG